ncbi:hypothetical protein GGF50DRAFT_112428 [Schizophyllum commune]
MYPVPGLSQSSQSYQHSNEDYLCAPAPIGAPGVCPPQRWVPQLPSNVGFPEPPFDGLPCRTSAMSEVPVRAPAPTRRVPPPVHIEIPSSTSDASPSPAPSSSASAPRKTTSRRHKDDPNYVPRPPNAYILFRKDYAAKIHKSTESDQRKISEIVTAAWKAASEATKAYYKQRQLEEKEAHLAAYPDYKYKPRPRGPVQRRKTNRNNTYEEARCKLLAELVEQKYEGEELEAELAKYEPELRKMYPVEEPAAGKKKRKARAVRGVERQAPFARTVPSSSDVHASQPQPMASTPTCHYQTAPQYADPSFRWVPSGQQPYLPPPPAAYEWQARTPPVDISARDQSDPGSLSSPATSAYSTPSTPPDSAIAYPPTPYGHAFPVSPLALPHTVDQTYACQQPECSSEFQHANEGRDPGHIQHYWQVSLYPRDVLLCESDVPEVPPWYTWSANVPQPEPQHTEKTYHGGYQ